MDKNTTINIAPGFSVALGKDGHWLNFESGGKHASLNVENLTSNIIRAAVVGWIDEQLKAVEHDKQGQP